MSISKVLLFSLVLAMTLSACNESKSTSAPKAETKVTPAGTSVVDGAGNPGDTDIPVESYNGVLLEKAPHASVSGVWRANDINYSIDGSVIQVDNFGKAYGDDQSLDIQQISFKKNLETEIFEDKNSSHYSEYLYLVRGQLINDAFRKSKTGDFFLYERDIAKLMTVTPESVVKTNSKNQNIFVKYPFTPYCQIGSNFVDIKDAQTGQKVAIATKDQVYAVQSANVYRYADKESPEAQVLAIEMHYSAADEDAMVSLSNRTLNLMLKYLSVNCYMPIQKPLSTQDAIAALNELLAGVAAVQ